jgi:HlyD family secretion protein
LSLKTAAVLVIALLVGSLGGYFLHDTLAPAPQSLRPPASGPRDRINALGRLQPAGGVVAVYGPPGDRIESLKIHQGQTVKKDDILAQLASHTEREMEEKLAEKQLAEAKRQKTAIRQAGEANLAVIDSEIAVLQAGKDSDLKAQRARIRVLESQLAQAKLQSDRLQALDPYKVPKPTPEIEKAALLVIQADGELDAAQALLKKTEETYRQNEAALKSKRAAAEAEMKRALDQVPEESLGQNVELARRRVELTRIKAPVDGTILKLIARDGHATGTQPILEMAGGRGMVVVAEIYETDIGTLNDWLKKGTVNIELTSEALPQPLNAQLKETDQVARMIARNELLSLNPRADVDRRVIEVRGELDSDSADRAARLVGLQVNVQLTPRP